MTKKLFLGLLVVGLVSGVRAGESNKKGKIVLTQCIQGDRIGAEAQNPKEACGTCTPLLDLKKPCKKYPSANCFSCRCTPNQKIGNYCGI